MLKYIAVAACVAFGMLWVYVHQPVWWVKLTDWFHALGGK